MRPTKDATWLAVAEEISRRSTCHRLAVGCVLANERGHVLSTGYNGRAAGLPNCNEAERTLLMDSGPPDHWKAEDYAFPHRCQNSDAPSGKPNGCEAIHAEQNALLQCRDVYQVETCYCTHSPCLTCVKLLLNTSCKRIVFVTEFPHPDSKRIWEEAGRTWTKLEALP